MLETLLSNLILYFKKETNDNIVNCYNCNALETVGITLLLNLVKDTHMLLTVKMSLDPAVMDALLLDQELFTLILNLAFGRITPLFLVLNQITIYLLPTTMLL